MRKLLSTYLLTAFCGWTAAFLVPVIIQRITHSAFYTSIAYAINFLPYLLVMPFFGVASDYLNKKEVIQFGELANICLMLGLAFVPFQENWLIFIWIFYFGLSIVVAIHHTTFQAVVPEIIPREEIAKFNSYAHSMNNLITLVAPVFVGFWLRFGTAKQLLYTLIIGYAICMVLISRIPYQHKKRTERLSPRLVFQSLREGLGYIRTQPFLIYALLNFFFINFGEIFIHSNLVHYFKSYHGIPEEQLSYYFIPIGLGALIGSAITLQVIKRMLPGKIILLGSFLSIASVLLIFVKDRPWTTAIFWGLHEVGNSIVIITFFSLRQRLVPPELLSRVIVISRILSYAAVPLAAVSSGWLFDYSHHFSYLLIISITSLMLGVVFSFKPLFSSKITHEGLPLAK